MKKILDSTQLEGDAFRIAGGRYQLVVKDWAGEVKVQIEAPESDPAVWIDTDQIFTADGVKAFWMSYEGAYRIVTKAVGASAYLQLVAVRAITND